jgi:hypothetical protein
MSTDSKQITGQPATAESGEEKKGSRVEVKETELKSAAAGITQQSGESVPVTNAHGVTGATVAEQSIVERIHHTFATSAEDVTRLLATARGIVTSHVEEVPAMAVELKRVQWFPEHSLRMSSNMKGPLLEGSGDLSTKVESAMAAYDSGVLKALSRKPRDGESAYLEAVEAKQRAVRSLSDLIASGSGTNDVAVGVSLLQMSLGFAPLLDPGSDPRGETRDIALKPEVWQSSWTSPSIVMGWLAANPKENNSRIVVEANTLPNITPERLAVWLWSLGAPDLSSAAVYGVPLPASSILRVSTGLKGRLQKTTLIADGDAKWAEELLAAVDVLRVAARGGKELSKSMRDNAASLYRWWESGWGDSECPLLARALLPYCQGVTLSGPARTHEAYADPQERGEMHRESTVLWNGRDLVIRAVEGSAVRDTAMWTTSEYFCATQDLDVTNKTRAHEGGRLCPAGLPSGSLCYTAGRAHPLVRWGLTSGLIQTRPTMETAWPRTLKLRREIVRMQASILMVERDANNGRLGVDWHVARAGCEFATGGAITDEDVMFSLGKVSNANVQFTNQLTKRKADAQTRWFQRKVECRPSGLRGLVCDMSMRSRGCANVLPAYFYQVCFGSGYGAQGFQYNLKCQTQNSPGMPRVIMQKPVSCWAIITPEEAKNNVLYVNAGREEGMPHGMGEPYWRQGVEYDVGSVCFALVGRGEGVEPCYGELLGDDAKMSGSRSIATVPFVSLNAMPGLEVMVPLTRRVFPEHGQMLGNIQVPALAARKNKDAGGNSAASIDSVLSLFP